MKCTIGSAARCAGVLAAVAVAAAVFVGCAKKVSIEEGKAKIQELASKGVPDRDMSDIKMYIYEMDLAQKTGNSSRFRIYQDSLTNALGAFEAKMADILANAGPFMDSLRSACDGKIAQLKGLHLEEAGMGKGPIDSLMAIESQKLYARDRLETWSLVLDTLITLQKLADSLRGEFVGIWVKEMESPDKNLKRVERKEIHMKKDGTLFIMDGGKGKLNAVDSDDWLFESYGTWDVYGDVAKHYITREKRVRQIFTGMDPQTKKLRTEKQPPYDSTVAKGKKVDAVIWEQLNKDYKRFRK
jgi:outer membrane murein-binding lipoprotein Lpp